MSSGSLEEQSFINLVKHFEDELAKIMNGKPASEVIHSTYQEHATNHKILDYRNGMWFLTKRAAEILQSK